MVRIPLRRAADPAPLRIPEPTWQIIVEPGFSWGWEAYPDLPGVQSIRKIDMGGYYGYWRPTRAWAIKAAEHVLARHLRSEKRRIRRIVDEYGRERVEVDVDNLGWRW